MVHHVRFGAIEMYLNENVYSSNIVEDKGEKANFWRACKPFSILHGQLMYNNKRLVVSFAERKHIIISDVHNGLGHSKG